ncbi:MAG: hypothetical protein J0L93_10710 [Deltaproteobacteria bacterium]|nr:hypothetical protein [Deltaproteobacteria bacterium]
MLEAFQIRFRAGQEIKENEDGSSTIVNPFFLLNGRKFSIGNFDSESSWGACRAFGYRTYVSSQYEYKRTVNDRISFVLLLKDGTPFTTRTDSYSNEKTLLETLVCRNKLETIDLTSAFVPGSEPFSKPVQVPALDLTKAYEKLISNLVKDRLKELKYPVSTELLFNSDATISIQDPQVFYSGKIYGLAEDVRSGEAYCKNIFGNFSYSFNTSISGKNERTHNAETEVLKADYDGTLSRSTYADRYLMLNCEISLKDY